MGLRAIDGRWIVAGLGAVALVAAVSPERVVAEDDRIVTMVRGSGSTPSAARRDALTAALRGALEADLGAARVAELGERIEQVVDLNQDRLVVEASVLSERRQGDVHHATLRVALNRSEVDELVRRFGGATEDESEGTGEAKEVEFPALADSLPSLGTVLARFDDTSEIDPLLAISDLREVVLRRDGKDLVLDYETATPWADAMFTVARCRWDLDYDENTGDRNGCEIKTHSAVGSRFRPMWYAPEPGFPTPISLLRAAVATPRNRAPLGPGKTNPLSWDRALPTPELSRSGMRTRVPAEWIKDHEDRYGRGFAFTFSLVTSCRDHPIVFDYVAKGDGISLTLDGKVDDWSGGPRVEDAGDELHPLFGHLDVTEVWVDHDAEFIFIRVDFAEPGFGSTPGGEGDLVVLDGVEVSVTPVGSSYMEPQKATIYSRSPGRGIGDGWSAAAGNSLEVRFRRHPNQGRVRVAVTSEVYRRDDLRSGRLEVTSR